jgi:BirA family biotin operon repressor/biotin-[acetyl-CoA-carboxylase] ligase
MTIPATQTPLITLTTALAIAKVFQSALGVNPSLKWPNDILIDNQKLAGILVESAFMGPDIEYTIIGIGINANSTHTDFPKTLQTTTTTLQTVLKRAINLSRLFGYLIGQLEFWYMKLRDKGFKAIGSHYQKLCVTLGKSVTIDLGDKQISGLAKELDPDGGLVIHTAVGRQIIRSGDVISSTSETNIE